jgi:hypothetical protein
MPSKVTKYHGLKDSPFYRLRTKDNLATLLFSSRGALERLCSSADNYREFQKIKKSGGSRTIAAPTPALKRVQKRIADLLQRLAPPDFLFAPVSGRSYVGNAAHHLGSKAQRLLDLEDFFPSCTGNKVIWFFTQVMGCSPDVAVMIKKLTTRNEALPQGSPCSPVLAYLCYSDMWSEVDSAVQAGDCKLSVYADDVTISGAVIPEQTAWLVKRAFKKHGHTHSPEKERSRFGKPCQITGVVLTTDGLKLPNRQHLKLTELRHEAVSETSSKKLEAIHRKISGRLAQSRQVLDFSLKGDLE